MLHGGGQVSGWSKGKLTVAALAAMLVLVPVRLSAQQPTDQATKPVLEPNPTVRDGHQWFAGPGFTIAYPEGWDPAKDLPAPMAALFTGEGRAPVPGNDDFGGLVTARLVVIADNLDRYDDLDLAVIRAEQAAKQAGRKLAGELRSEAVRLADGSPARLLSVEYEDTEARTRVFKMHLLSQLHNRQRIFHAMVIVTWGRADTNFAPTYRLETFFRPYLLSLTTARFADNDKPIAAMHATFDARNWAVAAAYRTAMEARERKEYGVCLVGLKSVLEARKDYVPACMTLARLYAGEEDPGARMPDLAMRYAKQSVDLTGSKYAPALETMARVYYLAGDLQNAVIWQDRACAADQTNDDYKVTLTRYLKELRDKMTPGR